MNKKISELPAATLPLSGSELMEVVQGGINKQVAKSDVATGGGTVTSVTGSSVDNTDTANPVVNAVPLTFAADTTIASAGFWLRLQGTGAQLAQFVLDAANNVRRALVFRTANVERWHIHTENNETGVANAGSDLHVERFDDAGVFIDAPFGINRTNGVAFFEHPLDASLTSTAVVITDAASMDLTDTKHTLTTASATRTFTISYTGDDISMKVILNATSSVFTFPAGALCVSEGIASGNNTCPLAGVSGDVYVFAIKHWGGAVYTVVCKNTGQ